MADAVTDPNLWQWVAWIFSMIILAVMSLWTKSVHKTMRRVQHKEYEAHAELTALKENQQYASRERDEIRGKLSSIDHKLDRILEAWLKGK